jgi:hypothetical protein
MTTESSNAHHRTTDDEIDEVAVRSVPLDTEDGGTVVIEQQNVGGSEQVGGGEYKNVRGGKTVEEAAEEQAELEREAPIADDSADTTDGSGVAEPDLDTPDQQVLPG